MTPSSNEIANLIRNDRLGEVLRGEIAVFPTPSYVNAEPWPTDHSELLEKGIYPLVPQLGAEYIRGQLENALVGITHDALGVFCAHQCFYVYMIDERGGKSPFQIDRTLIANALGAAFQREAPALRALESLGKDAPMTLPYKVTAVRMRILQRDYGITWPFDTSNLLP